MILKRKKEVSKEKTLLDLFPKTKIIRIFVKTPKNEKSPQSFEKGDLDPEVIQKEDNSRKEGKKKLRKKSKNRKNNQNRYQNLINLNQKKKMKKF